MIKINYQYLDNFKGYYDIYIYYVKPGTFLSFDRESLIYKGVEYLGFIPYKDDSNIIDNTINRLISKGVLEII